MAKNEPLEGAMDQDPWSDVANRIEALSRCRPNDGDRSPSDSLPLALLGAALALNRLRNEGARDEPLPQIHFTPWGSIVFYWAGSNMRRVEVLSGTEAWEYRWNAAEAVGRVEPFALFERPA